MPGEEHRRERDLLGEREVPREALYGIRTDRALENFPLCGRPVHPELVRAYGMVKLACAQTNRALGFLDDDPEKAADTGKSVRQVVIEDGLLSEEEFEQLISPEAVTCLGY